MSSKTHAQQLPGFVDDVSCCMNCSFSQLHSCMHEEDYFCSLLCPSKFDESWEDWCVRALREGAGVRFLSCCLKHFRGDL